MKIRYLCAPLGSTGVELAQHRSSPPRRMNVRGTGRGLRRSPTVREITGNRVGLRSFLTVPVSP